LAVAAVWRLGGATVEDGAISAAQLNNGAGQAIAEAPAEAKAAPVEIVPEAVAPISKAAPADTQSLTDLSIVDGSTKDAAALGVILEWDR
jgi:hypothetical protein